MRGQQSKKRQENTLLDFDYQPPHQSKLTRRRRKPVRRRFLLLLVVTALLIAPLLLRTTAPDTQAHTPPVAIQQPKPPEIRKEIVRGEIAPGDTVTGLLGGYFSPAEIYQLNKRSKPVFALSKLCAGQSYRLCLSDDAFERFEYDIDDTEQLIITREGEAFNVNKAPIPYTLKVERVRGVIESSLFEAVVAAGESDVLGMTLADIFAWDIDFILDIRKGDSFEALVEKRFRDGKPAGYGKVLAAVFTNQGDAFEAILFKDGELRADYYDAKGKSLRKAFLKAPLSFSRISSGFTMRRLHPITKTWKSHPAIDYAAPRGTPIKTVGDGVIIKKGYTRANGNYVKIRHNSTYETIYLHMKGFAKGIAKGKRVAQGQRIGYVGSTGLATGPHLCFRMYKNGSPVNPHKVKVSSAAPISKENRADFNALTTSMLAKLSGKATVVADNATQTSKSVSHN